MKKVIRDLFAEQGAVSMIRVLSLICVITSAIIALRVVEKGGDMSGAAVLCGTFLGAGIGGKVAQKITEVKNAAPR